MKQNVYVCQDIKVTYIHEDAYECESINEYVQTYKVKDVNSCI